MESKLQYYMRVFRGASFKKFFKVLDNAHERSGKNKIYLFLFLFHCFPPFVFLRFSYTTESYSFSSP